MSLNGAMGLGFALEGKDYFSPVARKVKAELSALTQDAARASTAFDKLGASMGKDGRPRESRGRGLQMGGSSDALSKATGGHSGAGGGILGSLAGTGGGGGSGILGSLAGFLSGGAIIGGLGKAVGAANEFTESLHNLKAISGATAPQMKALEDAAMKAGIATQFSPKQASDALGDLASAGYNVTDSLKLLNPTLDLAAASLGQLSPSDAAGIASQTLKAFSLSADDATATVDKLVQSINVFSIQPKDLALGIAGVSRGAGAMNQSLDESLIAFGLVHNIMPRVESAATAVSTAMERMVDPKVQQQLKGLGVTVADSAGKFRPFLDVVGDMLPALDKMTDAKRASFLQQTFGAEALGGFGAIMSQVTKGIQTQEGKTLRGADAIKYLREQIQNSKGAAATFRDELLKDLPGGLKQLEGSVQGFLIAIGKPMSQALAPIVNEVVAGLNKVIDFFSKLPDSAKESIGKVTLAVGALAAVFLIAGGPVTLVIGAIAAGILGLKYAVESNLGGIGDAFFAMAHKVGLAWDAMGQLLSQGGFSGKVREELNKAENSGLKAFIVGVFVWGHRIKHFLDELGEGFKAGLERAKPAFEKFGGALEKLGAALGLTSENDPSKNLSSWQKWGEIGGKVGTTIAGAIEWVAEALTSVTEFAAGAIDSFKVLNPLWDALGGAADDLGSALHDVGVALGLIDPTSQSGDWESFGNIIGFVAKVGLALLTEGITTAASGIKDAAAIFRGLMEVIEGFTVGIVTGNWSKAWLGMKRIVLTVVGDILQLVGKMVQNIAGSIDAMGKLVGKDFGAQDKVKGFMEKLNGDLEKEKRLDLPADKKTDKPTSLLATGAGVALGYLDPAKLEGLTKGGREATEQMRTTSMPAAALSAAGALGGLGGFGGVAAATAGRVASRPINVAAPHVQVSLDGQVIAAQVKLLMKADRQRGGADDPASDD